MDLCYYIIITLSKYLSDTLGHINIYLYCDFTDLGMLKHIEMVWQKKYRKPQLDSASDVMINGHKNLERIKLKVGLYIVIVTVSTIGEHVIKS